MMQTRQKYLLVVIGLFMGVLMATGASWAGSVDPAAGAVDGSGGPQSTTQIPPAWNQILPCDTPTTCVRFELVDAMGGAAVLDKETGLVWEKVPHAGSRTWGFHMQHCYTRKTGGVFGWRSPTIGELSSLLKTATNRPPTGHPFTILPDTRYWSATTCSFCAADEAWVVFTGQPELEVAVRRAEKQSVGGGWTVPGINGPANSLCVRGPDGVDGQ